MTSRTLSQPRGTTRRRLVLLIGVQVLIRAIGLVSGLGGIAVLARGLDQAEFGDFALCLTILGVATTLSELGLNSAAVRAYAADADADRLIAGALWIARIGTSVVGFIAAIVVLELTTDDAFPRLTALLVFGTLLLSPLTTGQAWGQAHLRVGTQNALLLSQSLLWPAGILLVAVTAPNLTAFAIAFATAAAVNAFAVLIAFRRGVVPEFKGALSVLVRLLRTALPLALSGLFITMYYRLSGIVLYRAEGSVASAEFAAGLRVVDALQVLPATLLVVVLPLLSKAFAGNTEKHRTDRQALFSLATRAVVAATVPIALGGAVLAPRIMTLLFGEEYRGAQHLFAILMLAFPAICLGYVVMSAALAGGQTRFLTAITASIAIANVGVTLWLVPQAGAMAAAAITLATEWTVVAAVMVMLYRLLGLVVPFWALTRSLVAGAVMAGAVYLLRDQPLWLALGAGVIVYVAAALAVGAFTRNDVRRLLSKDEVTN